jgi:hypothetical protein
MVEVAEELVEAVVGRQKLVAVAKVVLAELAGQGGALPSDKGRTTRTGRLSRSARKCADLI